MKDIYKEFKAPVADQFNMHAEKFLRRNKADVPDVFTPHSFLLNGCSKLQVHVIKFPLAGT
jgi:hypothetical protein